jgi:hypothetical protein
MQNSLAPVQHRDHKTEKLTAQFKEKDVILSRYFSAVSPIDYYNVIFGNVDEIVLPYVVEGEQTVRRNTIYQILLSSIGRSDVYIPYATFLSNWYRKSTADRLFAYVIDIDNLNPGGLRYFLMTLYQKIPFKPSYVVNSGSGLHLVFALDAPCTCYHRRHAALDAINDGLNGLFATSGNAYKLDKHWWGHTYRIAGSCTKIGQASTVYRTQGRQLAIMELAERFEVKIDLTEGRKGCGKAVRHKKSNVIDIKTGCKIKTRLGWKARGFFEWAFETIPLKSGKGHRYTSLFALAVIAQKCRIPEEEAVEKIKLVWEMYNEYAEEKGVDELSENELKKAIKGYHDDCFLNYKAAKLEELMGFPFPRKTKRVGRPRKDHLILASNIHQARTSMVKGRKIKELLLKGLSKAQIAREMGMSRMNLYKTYAHLFAK